MTVTEGGGCATGDEQRRRLSPVSTPAGMGDDHHRGGSAQPQRSADDRHLAAAGARPEVISATGACLSTSLPVWMTVITRSGMLERSQPRLNPGAVRLQKWRERQTLAEVRRVFVGGKAGTIGCDLEQHAG